MEMTKLEILQWYDRARQRIELRRRGAIPGWPLSVDDYESYRLSIERHFRHLKKAFNESLKQSGK